MLNKKSIYLPQYWPAWLAVSLLWVITRLPNTWQLTIGKTIGKILFLFPTQLKKITIINIKLCFPDYSPEQQLILAKKSFASLGIGLIETARAWWLPDNKLQSTYTLHGWEYADAALKKGKGIILLGPHFTSLEMIARLLAMQYSFAAMYRPHKKPFIAYLHERFRKKNLILYIPRERVRSLIRALNNNTAVWYAYDVDGGRKRSVFAPFFGIPTASLTAVTRMVTLTDTTVLPIYFYRRDDAFVYDIFIEKPFSHFPSGDFIQDATQLNAALEEAIRKKPEQYIWQYKRFKTRPAGEKRFY